MILTITVLYVLFLAYLPGSKERSEIETALKKTASTCEDVPIIIGGQEYRTKEV